MLSLGLVESLGFYVLREAQVRRFKVRFDFTDFQLKLKISVELVKVKSFETLPWDVH